MDESGDFGSSMWKCYQLMEIFPKCSYVGTVYVYLNRIIMLVFCKADQTFGEENDTVWQSRGEHLKHHIYGLMGVIKNITIKWLIISEKIAWIKWEWWSKTLRSELKWEWYEKSFLKFSIKGITTTYKRNEVDVDLLKDLSI